MDLSKNNQIDLLYLTNPHLKIKYNKQIEKLIDEDDIKFYRKRILQTTKDYLRGNKVNKPIDSAFEEYANQLINHYKFIDKKEMIQKEYKNLPKKEKKKMTNFKLLEKNKLMMKSKKKIKQTLEDFIPIVVKERKIKKLVMPKQINYDLKNPKNRKKGLEKE